MCRNGPGKRVCRNGARDGVPKRGPGRCAEMGPGTVCRNGQGVLWESPVRGPKPSLFLHKTSNLFGARFWHRFWRALWRALWRAFGRRFGHTFRRAFLGAGLGTGLGAPLGAGLGINSDNGMEQINLHMRQILTTRIILWNRKSNYIYIYMYI